MRIDPKGFALRGEALRLARELERWSPPRTAPSMGHATQELYEQSVGDTLRRMSALAERAARLEPHGMWHVDDDDGFKRVAEALGSAARDATDFSAYKARIYADMMCNAHIVRHVMVVRGIGRMQGVVARLNSGDLPAALPLARLLVEESLETIYVSRGLQGMMRQHVELLETEVDPFLLQIVPQAERIDGGPDAPEPGAFDPFEVRMRNFLMGRRIAFGIPDSDFVLNRYNVLTAIRKLAEREDQKWLLGFYGTLSELSHPSGPSNDLFAPYAIADGRRLYRFSTRGADREDWRSSVDAVHLQRLALGSLSLAGRAVLNADGEMETWIDLFETALLRAMADVPTAAHARVDRALRSGGFGPCTSPGHVGGSGVWPPLPGAPAAGGRAEVGPPL